MTLVLVLAVVASCAWLTWGKSLLQKTFYRKLPVEYKGTVNNYIQFLRMGTLHIPEQAVFTVKNYVHYDNAIFATISYIDAKSVRSSWVETVVVCRCDYDHYTLSVIDHLSETKIRRGVAHLSKQVGLLKNIIPKLTYYFVIDSTSCLSVKGWVSYDDADGIEGGRVTFRDTQYMYKLSKVNA